MMGIRIIDDGKHTTYGPYREGDRPEFTADPVLATVSFDIFGDEIRDAKLYHPSYSKVACFKEKTDEDINWSVINSNGNVSCHIENLYFTFTGKPEDTVKPDVEDEVNHPKHYTGHKAKFECIMFTELLPSLAANAFKYVWRCDDKGNKTEDLKKALWYLDRAYTFGCGEPSLDRRMQHLIVGMINSSDFDSWHKVVLNKIVMGYYTDAYNEISDMIENPECPVDTSIL